jgi:predicted ATPase
MVPLKRITVRGFKSIRALEDFDLRSLNVLIGANGAGKSNFISLFRMLSDLARGQLQLHVSTHDGPDALLFGTRRRTGSLELELHFGKNAYLISLAPAGPRLVFTREETRFEGDYYDASPHLLGAGHFEAHLPGSGDSYAPYVRAAIEGWRVCHFHDTSNAAPVRQAQPLRDNLVLKPDAANLAAFLRMLRELHRASYDRILEVVRLVAPFFGGLVHREDPPERIELEWFQRDDPDTPLGPRQLSDGTLRFIALATLLLQPTELQPATILIDEPELGLHPYAITLLASLLRQASERRQIIVATQSVELVNEQQPEDVVVLDQQDGASRFRRLETGPLAEWLQDYALGELWKMNVLGGRPSR